MIQTDSSTTIVREITIEAPAAAVFAALTEPEQLVAWWGTDSTYWTTAMERDLRVGGAWKTSGITAAGKPFSVYGVYRIVDPPHVLEYTWRHDWGSSGDGNVETTVRYDLHEHGGVTHLRLTHWGFKSPVERDDHDAGWGFVLELLRAYAQRSRGHAL